MYYKAEGMIELLLASNNQHKAAEIQAAIGHKVLITSLKDAGIEIDIPEPYDSLEANALEKCRVIFNITGKNCIGEDTGLEVAYLNGEPGVKSARYAGEDKEFVKNIEKLLVNMKDDRRRNARFRTVVSLCLNKKEYLFEGTCEGTITYNAIGASGFGYDSVFIPENSDKTFAQMSLDEKSFYSHRKKACDKLVLFLQQGVY